MPRIVDPFNLSGDEFAGSTADEAADNIFASLKVSFTFRCEKRRPFPNLRQAFRGHVLSDANRERLGKLADEWANPRKTKGGIRERGICLSPFVADQMAADGAVQPRCGVF